MSRLPKIPKMKPLLVALVAASLCGSMKVHAQDPAPGVIELRFTFGSEKEEWLKEVKKQFELSKKQTSQKHLIKVNLVPMGSGKLVDEVLQARRELALPPEERKTPQAHIISPASEIYIRLANAGKLDPKGGEGQADRPIVGPTWSIARSPIVIAMWKQNAESLGWGLGAENAPGWKKVFDLAQNPEGWGAVDFPARGKFIFGHTNPEYSASGLMAIIAQAYAANGKQSGLTIEDVKRRETRDFMAGIARSISQYGESTGFFGKRMILGDPNELHAAVLYESLVIGSYEAIPDPANPGKTIVLPKKRTGGLPPNPPIVAVYPSEGTFTSDHPIGIVEADWVDNEHREAAEIFKDYLLQKPRQEMAMDFGFRPGDQTVPLGEKFTSAYGVDPAEPKSLDIPDLDVMAAIRRLWRESKKKCDVVLAIDVSNSMAMDNKIGNAKVAAAKILKMFGADDRISILTFANEVKWKTPKLSMGQEKDRIEAETCISKLALEGRTDLYDAVLEANQGLIKDAGSDRISLVAILSDGMDTCSQIPFDKLKKSIVYDRDKPVIILTIGFGKDADVEKLKAIAELGRGSYFGANRPGGEDIKDVMEKVMAAAAPGPVEPLKEIKK